MCVYVPLIDDDYFEKTEYFYVHVESEENVEIHGSPYISVHIYDNDGMVSANYLQDKLYIKRSSL